jgi:hypothetical protein
MYFRWGDINLHIASDGTKYLEMNEKQTKTGENINDAREVSQKCIKVLESEIQLHCFYLILRKGHPKCVEMILFILRTEPYHLVTQSLIYGSYVIELVLKTVWVNEGYEEKKGEWGGQEKVLLDKYKRLTNNHSARKYMIH